MLNYSAPVLLLCPGCWPTQPVPRVRHRASLNDKPFCAGSNLPSSHPELFLMGIFTTGSATTAPVVVASRRTQHFNLWGSTGRPGQRIRLVNWESSWSNPCIQPWRPGIRWECQVRKWNGGRFRYWRLTEMLISGRCHQTWHSGCVQYSLLYFGHHNNWIITGHHRKRFTLSDLKTVTTSDGELKGSSNSNEHS